MPLVQEKFKPTSATVEEIDVEGVDSSSDISLDEYCDHPNESGHVHSHGDDSGDKKGSGVDTESLHRSRNEKKARKILSKLELKPVPGITRVTICRSKTIIFAISHPEVYKCPNSNSYIVFGEAKVEDLGAAAQVEAARRLKMQDESMKSDVVRSKSKSTKAIKSSPSREEEEKEPDSGPIDDSGMDEKDISIIIDQCNVSRAKAIKALKESDNDLVNAIMLLTED